MKQKFTITGSDARRLTDQHPTMQEQPSGPASKQDSQTFVNEQIKVPEVPYNEDKDENLEPN